MATELPTVSEPKRAERCETCKWWDQQYAESLHGLCRRSPPMKSMYGDGIWVLTEKVDWCGEWRAK